MTDGDKEEEQNDGSYDNIEDGAGCAEIWEKLSRRRRKERLAED